jgi:hypothetical protein
MFGVQPDGPVLPSVYVAPNVPESLQSKFGPTLAAYDRAGQGFWYVPTANGAELVSPPFGHEVPSQWELQGTQLARGFRDFFAGLPGAIVETGLFIGDGYRMMAHAAAGDLGSFGPRSAATGNMTFDSFALGVVKSTPAGALFGSPRDMGVAMAALPFAAAGPLRAQGTLGVAKGEAGRFADLAARAVKGDKLTPHHMPQAAAGFTSRADGGAFMLPEAEHMLTRTYGFRGAITAQQEAGMAFRDVLARDIRDVRSIGGTQYNQGLRDLLDYYRRSFPELVKK